MQNIKKYYEDDVRKRPSETAEVSVSEHRSGTAAERSRILGVAASDRTDRESVRREDNEAGIISVAGKCRTFCNLLKCVDLIA